MGGGKLRVHRRERTFRCGTNAVEPVFMGTRWFALEPDMMPGKEIGFSKEAWERKEGECPFPPEMWFATEMLDALVIGPRPSYPGWSYNTTEQLSPDSDLVRYEMDNGKFWIWELTGERDAINNREFGKWPD